MHMSDFDDEELTGGTSLSGLYDDDTDEEEELDVLEDEESEPDSI